MTNQDKNAKDILKQILNTNEGKKAAKQIENLSASQIKDKLNSIDKNELVKKLNSMNLGKFAKSIQTTDPEVFANMIAKNPQLLNKLNNLIK